MLLLVSVAVDLDDILLGRSIILLQQLAIIGGNRQPRSEIRIKSVGHWPAADQTADKYPLPKTDEHRKSEVSPLTNPEEGAKEIHGKFDNCL